MKNKYYYTVLPYSYYRKNRKYANGSFMAAQDKAMKENFSNGAGFSSVMGMLGGASDILKTSVDLAQIADTTETENALENMGTDVNASGLDSLMKQWGATANTGNSYTWRDVRGKSGGEIAGGILGAGLSGATAGAAAGPIGAIVGGAIGLIGSGIGAAVGRNKAEQKAGQLNDMANEANLRQQLAFASNAESIMDQQNLAAMSTLAAHGGKIYIKPSKRGTFTAAAKRRGLGVQEFASKVLANKDRYSSAMVKKANFARNFGGHRKDEGGYREQAKGLLKRLVKSLTESNSGSPSTPDSRGSYIRTPLQNDSTAAARLMQITQQIADSSGNDIRYRGPALYKSALKTPEGMRGLITRSPDIHYIDSLSQVGNWREAADKLVEERLGGNGLNTNIFNPSYLTNEALIQRMRDVYGAFKSAGLPDNIIKAVMAMNYDETLTDNIDDLYNYKKTQRPTSRNDDRIINYGLFSFENLRRTTAEEREGGITTKYVEDAGMPLGKYRAWLQETGAEDSPESQARFWWNEYIPTRMDIKQLEKLAVEKDLDKLMRAIYNIQGGAAGDTKIRNAVERAKFLEGSVFKNGGPISSRNDFSNGVTKVENGGTHEQNPMEGVPMGIAPDGLPNLVEEGEVIFNDYVFSNRLKPEKKDLEKMNLKKYKNRTFAQIAKNLQKESEERPNDPISKNGLEDSMAKLTALQEEVRNNTGKSSAGRIMWPGGPLGEDLPSYWVSSKYFEEPHIYGDALPSSSEETAESQTGSSFSPDSNMSFIQSRFFPKFPLQSTLYLQSAGKTSEKKSEDEDSSESPSASLPTGLRYAPAIGSLIGSIASAFAKPDYEHSDSLLGAASRQRPSRVRFRPVGNYMRYNPLNTSYMMNRLNAETAGTRRTLENMSGGNAAAARNQLTALNRSSQDALGDTFIKASQYNDNLRRQVEEFNRGTNMFNSQGAMQADSANAQMQNAYDARRLAAVEQAMRMREAADAALEQSRALNFTNLFDNLGDIGRENFTFNQIRSNPAWGYSFSNRGETEYKKCGGMLTKRTGKRRRR